MYSESDVFFRSQLLAQGHSRGHIDYLVSSGLWIKVHRGVYVDAKSENLERSMLRAHLAACGPGALLSHSTAATLHSYDSTKPREQKTTISASRSCGVRSNPAQNLVIAHTRTLDRFEVVDDLPVTTRARTLLDVSAKLSDIECERVLESALRGSNPKRPDKWRTEVLDELTYLLQTYPRHPGASRVRRVLLLRPPDCRPTGSFPETVLVQLLRTHSIEVIRQPTLVVTDLHGRRFEYFPDLLIVAGRCIVEVDGDDHLEQKRARTDAARQNRLIGFDVFRYPATTILNDPTYAANEVVGHVNQVRNQRQGWTESGRTISGNGNHWKIAAQVLAA